MVHAPESPKAPIEPDILALLGPLAWIHRSPPSGGATNDTPQINSLSTLDADTPSHSDANTAQGQPESSQ